MARSASIPRRQISPRRLYITFGLALTLFAAWFIVQPDRRIVRVSDAGQKSESVVAPPWKPFRDGAIVVAISGELDGTAQVQISSNQGHDHSTIFLKQGKVSTRLGAGKFWTDDLHVAYEPATAKHGSLKIQLYCASAPEK